MKLERYYSKFKGKRAAGIFLRVDGESPEITVVLLQERDYGIVIDNFWSNKDLDRALEDLPPHTPAFLAIDGKGIITRKLADKTTENVIGQLFPNMNTADVATFECGTFVSIARNNTVEEYVESILQRGVDVTNLYLGTSILQESYSFIKGRVAEIVVKNISHRFLQEELVDIVRLSTINEEPTYQIDDKDLTGDAVVAFSAGLRFWTSEHIDDGIHHISIESSRSNYLYALATRKLLPWLGLPLLGLLLINFVIYSSVYDQNVKLKSQLRDYQSAITQFDLLKKGYDTRLAFAKKNNSAGRTRNAFYFDQISSLKPSGILFTKIENAPTLRKSSAGEMSLFQTDLIVVKGSVSSGQVLNEWIKGLRELPWIVDVKVNSFEMKESSNTSVFEIHIKKRAI